MSGPLAVRFRFDFNRISSFVTAPAARLRSMMTAPLSVTPLVTVSTAGAVPLPGLTVEPQILDEGSRIMPPPASVWCKPPAPSATVSSARPLTSKVALDRMMPGLLVSATGSSSANVPELK